MAIQVVQNDKRLILIKGRLHPNDLTNTEIEIGFNLSMDEQMQGILNAKKGD